MIAAHPSSSAVLHQLWPLNREAMLRSMVELHNLDPASMVQIMYVCADLKVCAPPRLWPAPCASPAQIPQGTPVQRPPPPPFTRESAPHLALGALRPGLTGRGRPAGDWGGAAGADSRALRT